MIKKFTTPCFVCVKYADQREKLITWLEHIGYDCSTARTDVEYYGKTEPIFMVVNGGDCRIQHNRPMLIEEHDCGTDVEMFKALAAMNSENDREQWFVAKCDINDHGTILWHERDLGLYDEVVEALRDLFRKATAEELINHFKSK